MPTPTQKLALKLPEAAKTGIMDGLSGVLDKLTAIATMVGEADVDDQSAVPGDLGGAMKQAADILNGIADQFAPAEAPTEAPPEQAPPPEPEAKTAEGTGAPPAHAPALGALPPAAPSAGTPAAKGLPPEQHEGENMAPLKDGLTMSPKTMSIAAQLSAAMASDIVEMAKAGRKIAANRYKKLSDLHGALGSLLNELAYDESLPEPAEAPAKKTAGTTSQSPIAKQLAAIEASLKNQGAQIARIQTTPQTSRARANEGGDGAPSGSGWPLDMSADISKRRAAR